jgi:hypothetical protein
MLKSRGYETTKHDALNSGYYCTPTPFQTASHGEQLESVIKSNDTRSLRLMMEAGLSSNACNQEGESIAHVVCRHGLGDCLDVLVEYGCSLQVADVEGRTPLHEACLAAEPSFRIVDMILKHNRRLFYIADEEGELPLSYIQENQWTAWTKYFMSRKEVFWPDRLKNKLGFEAEDELALQEPNSHPVPNPVGVALPLGQASAIGQGLMDPSKVVFSQSIRLENLEAIDLEDFDDDDSESTFDSNEMEEILGCIGSSRPIAWATSRTTAQ